MCGCIIKCVVQEYHVRSKYTQEASQNNMYLQKIIILREVVQGCSE
jgi:hypothetical protein